jgi:hypothetical protein
MPYQNSVQTSDKGAYAFSGLSMGVTYDVKVTFCGKVLQTRSLFARDCINYHQLDFGVDALLLNAAQPGDQAFENAAFALDRTQLPTCSAESDI